MSPVTTVDKPKGVQGKVGQGRLRTLLVLAATAVIVMAGVYLVDRPSTTAAGGVTKVDVGPSDGPAPTVGKPAKDFSATTVDGKRVSLSSYKGHPVWLTFGASWCAACAAEAPDVEAAYQRHLAQGVVVLSVSIKEDDAAVLDFGKRIGLTFPEIADPDQSIAAAYQVYGIPAHFFIDRSGILRLVKTGGLSPDQMDAALREINR
jgi:cytochrome c biogenesis protein CcmG, thiol:disulfide interchange protein DsbE